MTRQKQYYKNHKAERLAYQKEWRRNHKDGKLPLKNRKNSNDLPSPQVKHQVDIENSLINDIKDFIPICHRKPTAQEVLDWSELYGIKNLQDGTKWARKLIERAMDGTKIKRKIYSEFVLYEDRMSEMPILNEPRLSELTLLTK
jgi:hypothetical protein